MNREYLRWYSQRLHREMELLVFGHAGVKVLVFPTREGRFFEYEQLGIVASLADRIEAGQMQLYCIEGLATESFYAEGVHPKERMARHAALEDYVLHEVMPLMAEKNDHVDTIVHGCSLGAFQAASLAFRHPHLFRKLVAFSGRFDLTLRIEAFGDLFEGYYDDNIYYHMPSHFLPGLECPGQLESLRRMEIVLTIGNEDPFFDNNVKLADTLYGKGIDHRLHVWEGRAHRGSAWRKMAPLYL